ncbi:prephenate dehydrogenase [Herbihabitans rhizosphaerae]|uniref:Prephenate dehydrogenase n=1 Tax=Herbihabitans rhizosphaerae TaxID=1872711 RepID=A0A4Q7L6P8_9PSEU|nr:prephenate dehydrogenase [Herbihabitans rhizosphaerae]RZS44994.1 prephenate dehydrogenase [Herbihabitans rhizosphaerae]
MRPVCVIGLGLIGGSVLRAAAASGREVLGGTLSTEDAEAAAADGFTVESTVDDALRAAAERDAIVVIAVPLPAVDEVLRRVAVLAPDCLLTDVVSVKTPVRHAVSRLAPATVYIGGHPMAGTSSSGWAASSATLFQSAAWVVTVDDGTPVDAWRTVAELALDLGAHVVPTTASEHDDAVARVSHLPHLLAAVLAAVGADGGPLALALAAGSFGDGTRVAGSSPELVRAMCEGNQAPLREALDEALGRLGAARGSLASTGSLGKTVHSGHDGRRALDGHRAAAPVPIRLDLAAPEALAGLRALGAQGGRIVRLDGDDALGEVPPEPAD